MTLNYRLCADVIKFWRQDTEERALAEYILKVNGLTLEVAHAMTVVELTDVLRNYIEGDPKTDANKEKEVTALVAEETVGLEGEQGGPQDANEGQDADEKDVKEDEIKLDFREQIKIARGRKKKVLA